jgi:hypothetical protein
MTRPPFFTALSASGTSVPTGAKMIAASSGSGGRSSELPAQTAPSEVAKRCDGRVPRSRECVDAPALPGSDLRQDMGGCAEAVEAERKPRPGHAIAAPADEAGAQQRRRFQGIELLRQRKAESRVGEDVRGIATVSGIAGEDRMVA